MARIQGRYSNELTAFIRKTMKMVNSVTYKNNKSDIEGTRFLQTNFDQFASIRVKK